MATSCARELRGIRTSPLLFLTSSRTDAENFEFPAGFRGIAVSVLTLI